MATHSSTLAWKIPWMEETGRLQSMGSHRVRHGWSNLAAAASDLLTVEKCLPFQLPLLEWRMLLLYTPVRNSQEHGPTSKRTNHKKREKLANSWGNWSNIWSWASWLLPLTGPLFMLFAVLLFGPCILNAVTQFITSWIESIKLQVVTVQCSPLNDRELWMSYQKHEMMLSTTSDRSIKRGRMKTKSWNFT